VVDSVSYPLQADQAQVPPEHATGYRPRLTALIGEIAGTHGTSRHIIQHICALVLQVPLSLGAIQKLFDRAAQVIAPHYGAIATQARQAPVNYIDATSWFLTSTLQWLWVMVSDTATFYMIHPHRYQTWVAGHQTSLVHPIRMARGLAEHQPLRRAGSGGRGMRGCVTSSTNIVTVRMRWRSLHPACSARWTRCGSSSPSTG
jgi:Transposase IS66 family